MCVYSTEKPDLRYSCKVLGFWQLLAFSSGVTLATIYSDGVGLLSSLSDLKLSDKSDHKPEAHKCFLYLTKSLSNYRCLVYF